MDFNTPRLVSVYIYTCVNILKTKKPPKKPTLEKSHHEQSFWEWKKSRSSTKEISIGTSKITCKYQPLQYVNFSLKVYEIWGKFDF